MKFTDLIITANRNLSRSKLRTLLTILAIFVGGFTLSLTTALNTGAQDYLNRQLGNVSVPGIFSVVPKADFNPLGTSEVKEYDPDEKASSIQAITAASMKKSDVTKLSNIEGVESAQPLYTISSDYLRLPGEKKYASKQMTQDIGLNLDLAAGRLLTATDKKGIVLPDEYIEPLGFTSDQEAIGKTVQIGYKNLFQQDNVYSVKIVGVMKKTFLTQGQIFVDFNTARVIAKAQGQDKKFIGSLVRFAGATDQTNEKELKDRITNAGNFTAVSLKERIGTVTAVVTAITAGLSVVGLIALFAASFGIINTLLMSVYERTKEIGLMKALGMHRGRVFALFAIEAVLVGFWGSVVAIAAAYGTSLLVNQYATANFLKDFEGFTLLIVNPAGALSVAGLIMTIAFLAGTLPALKASRLNPIDALRSE